MKSAAIALMVILLGLSGILGVGLVVGLICRLLHIGWSIAWTPM